MTPNVQALTNVNQRNFFFFEKKKTSIENHFSWENMLGWALFLTKGTFAIGYACISENVTLLNVKS